MRCLTIFVIFFSIAGNLPAQIIKSNNKKASKLFEQGKKLQENRDFENALIKYNEAIRRDSLFAEAYWQAGAACNTLRLTNQANAYYWHLANKFPDEQRYLGAHLKLAEASFAIGNYKDALLEGNKYLSLKTNKDRYYDKANAIVQNCQFALSRIEKPLNFNPRPLVYPINQFKQQYFPVLSADQSSLFFIKRDQDEEIYTSIKLQDDLWSLPVPIDSAITSEYNEGTCSVSADGRTLVFTSCMRADGFGSCDLYITHKSGDSWSPPQNMGRPINSSAWDSQPALSADGKTLYYVSNRKGGLGNRDIWVTYFSLENGWSNPKNLGTNINTIRDDISPFIHVNGQTLYFATNGRLGFGGFDIYYSEKVDEQRWGTPINFGFPINTYNDELAMFITPDGAHGYYSYETKEEDEFSSKLYQIDIPEEISLKNRSSYVAGTIYDSLTSKPLSAEIALFNMSADMPSSEVVSDSVTGQYLMVLTEGAEYALYINAPNYLFKSYHFDLDSDSIGMEGIVANIALSPIKTGKKTKLSNVLFEHDSYALTEKSKKALLYVIEYLNNHPDIAIEIAGHTDDLGSDAYNLRLSKDRAYAVYDYFLSNGVGGHRMTYRGYGSIYPVASNDNYNERAKNRRIELEIIK